MRTGTKLESPMIDLAVNNPDLCVALLKHIFPEHPSENNPLDCLEQFYWPYGEDGQADTDWKFKRFVQLCAQYYTEEDCGSHFRLELSACEEMLDRVIKEMVRTEIQRVFRTMLWKAEVGDVEMLARSLMSTDELAKLASADVIVSKNRFPQRGNLGRYVVTLRIRENVRPVLRFTNKSSMIYYLMLLIDRKQRTGKLTALSLKNNKDAFVKLYECVYNDISLAKIIQRVSDLILRKSDDRIRVGRLNEIIFDIRKHLEEVFRNTGESFYPYAMTADTHLTVSPTRIYFEGDAQKLLDVFHFNP